MSKRDMRAKKLLLAVLLAMSMQSYYAAPTWAAEAGQPAGQTETVDGKGQSDGTTTPAADEAETVKKTDTKQEADEALTIMGYSVNTLNADEDAGIMPTLVGGYTGSYNAGTGSNYTVDYATAVGYNAVVNHLNSTALGYNASTSAEEQVSFGHWDSTTSTWTTTRSLAGIKNIEMAGALTGVTTINGANFTVDETNGNIAIGILAKIESSNPSSETIHVVALGERAAVTGLGGVAVGFEAHAYAEEATALGYCAEAYSKYSIAIGSGAQAREENNIVIGTNSDSIGADSVVIGSGAFGDARNSIAIGAGSSTETDNEVNFGYYNLLADGSADMGNPYFGRSLAGISSIDFIADIDGNKGAITGLSSINGVTVVGTDASTGLTVGGNAIIGKTDIPFSSNGFSVNNTGAITAASGTIGGITLNGGKLDKITSINGANFTTDNNSIAVGALAIAEDYGSAFGLNSQAKGSSSVAIGNTAKAKDSGSIAIGSTSIAEGANSIAIGVDNLAEKEGSIAIGTSSYAENIGSIALGSHAEAPHDNSVAIGSKSFTTADNQVAFGTGTVNADKTVTWTNRRSLAGISDIEMHGGIMGLTSINGVAVSGSTAAGLTIGGITLNNGGIIGEVTEDNYKMKINGLDFYTGINEEWDKGSMAFGKDSVIGNITGSTTFNAIAIGTGADAESDNAIALGAHSLAYTEDDMVGNAMAIGAYAGAYSSNSVAFGYQAYVARFDNSEEHNLINNSMALGTYSSVNTSDTVSFGHKVGDGYGDAYPSKTYTDNLFRSLVNVKDIELNTADDGTGGAITGLTSINGVYFSAAADQSHLLIGSDERTSTNKNNTGIGVLSVADGDSTVAVGYEARAAEDRSIAIGAYSKAYAADSIVIGEGSEITNTGLGSIALGRGTKVVSQNSIAIGNGAHISDENQLFSVAIGADSTTSKETQVSFGHKQDDLDAGGSSFGHDLFRSVVNVADIEMHGGITGLTSIEGVAVSGSAAAGLTVSGVTLNGGKVNEVALGLKGGAGTDKDNVLVGGVDLTALSQSSGGNTGDITALKTKTEGIERTGDGSSTPYATTIEGVTLNSNKVTASGGIVVDSNNQLDAAGLKASKVNGATITSNTFNEVLLEKDAGNSHYKVGDVDVTALSDTIGDATKGLVKDTADLKTAVGAADTGLAAVNTKVTDLQTATTGMSYDSGTTSTSFSGNVVVGNVGNQTHTQITDNAIIFGQGAEKQVTVDASGIHVGAKAMNGISTFADSNGTHIDHTSLVTGTVTAANLNGVAISGNATDGLSVGGVNIKTLDDRLATLKTTVDDIQNSGVGTADMAGVQRSDADGDGINDTTTIETATSFTKAGMKTSNLEALTAAIGGVNFAAGGVVTGINSINGTVFSSDGKIGGVSLSGGKVNGVDIKWLDQRVTSLEGSGTGGGGTGGGGGASTSGIGKPDGDTTTIEGNTTVTGDGIETNKVTASDQIIVADGKDNQTVISEDGIKVAEGKTNEVTINDKGIHVGKNSSVMNDTEGFITDKGLYIGVNSSNDISTAKFSVDKGNGTMTSKVGGYTFTNGSSGAVFSHSGDTAVTPGGSFTETTIKGNKVTTGRLDADELYVDGNKVNIAGGTIGQTDAVANHLEGTDGDGNKVTNDFKTSALNGTTQAAEQTSADGKNIIKTENNTSAGGTSVTTSKTSTNSADRKTEQSSSFVTNESGMSLNTSTKVTDKDGNVTKNTSGETKMSGDSLTVSKTTVTSKDGKEETTTSSTTVGSGEVTLHREDGSTIRVGEAIEGMQGQIQDIGSKVNEMGVEIKEVGALSAALAGLHPQPENANSRADFAMAMGSYEGKQALAVGGFYRPDKRTMLSIGASTTSSKHMMNMGISIALDKLPEAERNEQESNADLAERMKKLEADYEARLEKMEAAYEARMERLEARYARMKDAYEADKEQQKQQEVADETQENAEAASA